MSLAFSLLSTLSLLPVLTVVSAQVVEGGYSIQDCVEWGRLSTHTFLEPTSMFMQRLSFKRR
jgi:hypothetical protein